jgi:starch synthase (maltosyl-transferring)
MFLTELLRIRRQAARLMETYKIDVVQTHLLEVLDFLFLSLRNDVNPRVVLWTVHNVDFLPTMEHWLLKPKRFVYRWLYRLTAGTANGFIAVSDGVRDSVIRQIGLGKDKVITIANGIDIERYELPGDKAGLCDELGIPATSFLIASVGRLTPQKGFSYLLDAAATLFPAYPHTHFLFIGDGELRDELLVQAKEAGIAANVHFLGVRDDVPALLAAADLFALPSLWEGLSIALLETMSASKPIVATAVSGTTQVMIPGRTGFVVPPGDSQALVDAIIRLLTDPAQAKAMGRAAKQHVSANYSAQKQSDEHLALYHRLVNEDTPLPMVEEGDGGCSPALFES